MSNSIITQGEYNALVKIWNHSPSYKPKGVRWETLWNLQAKNMLNYERDKYGYERWWLTDEGKQAMDEYPHRDRIAKARDVTLADEAAMRADFERAIYERTYYADSKGGNP